MVGIGLIPFVFFPWVFIGPLFWWAMAVNCKGTSKKLSRFYGGLAASSVVIPLLATLRSWEDAAIAGMIVAGISFLILLIVIGFKGAGWVAKIRKKNR